MKSKKIVKTIFKIVGILVGVIIILAIVLPLIFKKQIIQAVKTEINKSLNATVDFKDYHLSLFRNFPNFTLGLDNLTVVGQKEFEKDTLANIEKVRVTIGLFSVIKGDQYNIKRIAIESPKIKLLVLHNGKANWDIAKPSTEKPKPGETEKPSAFKLSIQKLSISHANVRFDDKQADMHASVYNLNHTLSGDLTADITSLSTKTSIDTLNFSYGGIKYLHKMNLEIKADIEADLKNSKYTFKDNEFRFNELYLKLDGWLAMLKDGYDMDLKFAAAKTDFKNFLSLVPAIFMKDFDKVKAGGKLGFDGYAKGKYNEKIYPAFGLNLSVDNGSFQYPGLPKSVTNIIINANVANKGGSLDNTLVNIKKLHIEMAGNPVDAQIYVATPISDPQVDARIKGRMDLAQVKDFYPLEEGQSLNGIFTADVTLKGRMSYIDKKQYEKFNAKGLLKVEKFAYTSKSLTQPANIRLAELRFSPAMLELTGLDATMGKSDFQASGMVENYLAYFFRNELLKGNFKLNSRFIDVSSFMSSSETPAAPETDSEEAPSTMTVIEVPKNVDFVLTATVGKLLYEKMDVTNINGGITLRESTLNMDKLSMNLLGGSMVLGGMYSTKNPDVPKIDLQVDGKGLDIPQVMKHIRAASKFAGILRHASGNFSISMKYASDLKKNMSPDYATVNASGGLTTSNITITNADILNKLSDALKINLFKSIHAQDVNLTFSIVNGTLFLKPSDIKFSKSVINVEGSIRLDNTINLVLKLGVPRSEFGTKANGVLNDLTSKASASGVPVNLGETVYLDVLVTGTTKKPVFKIGLKGSINDLVNDLKDKAKEEIKKTTEEVINKGKEEASAQAQKIMDEARAKAQQLKDEAKKAGDALVAEADKQGKALEDQATNPFTKAAAKESRKQLVKVAQDKSNKLQQEAAAKADKLLADAQAQADKLKK